MNFASLSDNSGVIASIVFNASLSVLTKWDLDPLWFSSCSQYTDWIFEFSYALKWLQ